MDSYVYLGINKMELDWGKTQFIKLHSKLFLPSDEATVVYHYGNNVSKIKKGYRKKLSEVKERLDLLGYQYKVMERAFNELKKNYSEDGVHPNLQILSFKDYYNALRQVDLSNLSIDFDDYGDFSFGEFVSTIIFEEKEFNKELQLSTFTAWEAEFFENLDCYINIRILAENINNQDLFVEWRVEDLKVEGYFTSKEIYTSLEVKNRILIVTEGSSDLFVIKKAINLLRPNVSDFFYFVDMKEHYPFSGTGNLVNFVKGLCSIQLLNNVLVIFDNDTEGLQSLEKCKRINLPDNIQIISLPSLKEFEVFPCSGPSGEFKCDINSKAVAIENFLDLNYKASQQAVVRWTNFVDKANAYQGSLDKKSHYIKQFKKVTRENVDYDFSKLEKLVEKIINECIVMKGRL